MRVILVAGFLLIYFILSVPLLAAAAIYKALTGNRDAEFIFRWVTWGFRRIKDLSGTDLTVNGADNIPQDETVLFVGNHQSYFDIVIAYGLMERPTGFVAKKELMSVPVLSSLMKCINCLFLDRSDLRKGMEMIKDASGLILRGVNIAIYPEGTRNDHPDEFLEFHKGSFKIAQRTGCAIIPMTINGSREIFEAHVPWVKPAKVIIEYGKPVRYRDLDREDQKNIHLYVKGILEDTYKKNNERLMTSG